MKILITGGTGLIGQYLTKKLLEKNYEVAILSRNPKKENQYKWDISKQYIDEKALRNTDYIIHLAGAGIADKRWSEKQKQIILNSRIESANLLFNKIKEHNILLRKFISASGIGYYGATTSETIFEETHKPHNDFIAKVCIEWENSVKQFSKININQTILRTGVVLAEKDSALQKINTPLFLASLGTGKQYFPWIHIEDLCNLYVKAIEDESFNGIYNAVSPDFQTNKSFTKTLSKTVNKPFLPIGVPKFVLNLTLGEMSSILLEGSRISYKKTSTVYNFSFPELTSALENIYKKNPSSKS